MPRGIYQFPLSFADTVIVGVLVILTAYLATGAVEPMLAGSGPSIAHLVAAAGTGLLATWWVYDEHKPRYDTACETCGKHVYVHENEGGASEAVVVEAAGTPRRQTLGRLSIIRERKTSEDVYCSGECAGEDGRFFVHPYSAAAEEEVSDSAA